MYAQVQVTRWTYAGEPWSGKVARVTAKKPESRVPDSVLVKLTLDIDDQAFKPLEPSIAVTIPAEHTDAVREVTSEPLEVPS
jgi:hypothetical protein